MNKICLRIETYICICICLLTVLSLPLSAFDGYIHDPRENPSAMADIVEDENAVYGFRPSPEGSLKAYADVDWSNPGIVEKGRQDRIAYHQSIESMYEMLREMTSEGRSVEEIARAVSARRNEIRLEAYDGDPEGLAAVIARNLEQYGHEEGPLPEELFEKYGSWDRVIEKAFSVNSGMDACLGLYDDYYDLYVAVGQIEKSAPPAAGEAGQGVVAAAVLSLGGCAALLAAIRKRGTKKI